jgi:hypothetical protein
VQIYKPQLRAEVKKLFVDDGLPAYEISKLYAGHPSTQTVLNWADRFSWYKDRQDLEVKAYEALTPQSIQQKFLQKVNFILNKDLSELKSKDADAIIKFIKSMKELLNKDFQLPMMYQVLTDLLEFIHKNYPEFMKVNENFLIIIQHFKNELLERSESESFLGSLHHLVKRPVK